MTIRSAILQQRLALAAWAAILFAFCISLDVRHDHFPYCYHPDEPWKVEQIISGKWNFHHPMLMLTVTKLVVDVLHVPKEPQAVVQIGRRVSASFMAAAIVAFSLTAFLWRGWTAAFIAGAALAWHHQLYELAHYMKEDSALLVGVAFTCLAALAYCQRASTWRAVALGAACALATSGKYIGVSSLGLALPVLWVASPGLRCRRIGLFLAVMVAVFALVNLPLLLDFGTFRESFAREMKLVTEGQGETTRRVPHAVYWKVFIDNSNPVMWLLLIAFCAEWRNRRHNRTLAQRLIVIFPFAFAVALSFSPKDNDRYFLPATAIFTFLAALGAEDAPLLGAELGRFLGMHHPERLLTGPYRRWIVVGSAFALCFIEFSGWAASRPGLARYDDAFVHDDIAELIAWIRNPKNIPEHAIVAADDRARLPDPERPEQAAVLGPLPQKLLIGRLAADFGTLDELRAQGVKYVVISESSYGQFFRGDLRAKKTGSEKFNREKAFYEELLRSGNLLFERERGTVIYLHPGIRVYKL